MKSKPLTQDPYTQSIYILTLFRYLIKCLRQYTEYYSSLLFYKVKIITVNESK